MSLKLSLLFDQTGVLIKLDRGKTLNSLRRLTKIATASSDQRNE